MHSPDPETWQAWENSCHNTQDIKIDHMATNANEYAVTEKDQEVDSHTGKVFYESLYRAVCRYNKNDYMYHCNWQDSNLKDRYEYQITSKALYDNWANHIKDKNKSIIWSYAIYDHKTGQLMASSATSRISWPETFAGHLMETHDRSCGERLKAEDVLQPGDE